MRGESRQGGFIDDSAGVGGHHEGSSSYGVVV